MFNSLHSSTRRYALAAAAAFAVFPLQSTADTVKGFPSKPITIVVPFAAGAGTDLVARSIAEKLGGRLGSSVVVENRTGAAGVIGTTYVAKASPDGHTLLFSPNSIAFAHLVSGGAKPAYDPVDSFKPVIEVGKTPVFLVSGPQSGVKTFPEALAKSKTTPLSYGSAGSGSIAHFIGETVNQATGINLSHVPYKGTSQSVVDVIGGHVAYAYAAMSTIEPHLASQKIHILATTGGTRTELAATVPTLAELGYPSVNLGSWYGIYAPRSTPDPIVELLNRHIDQILKMPEIVETMKKQGSTVVGGAPAVLDKTTKTETAIFQKLTKDLKISAY
jgi:tripartite-type tricarboxylate transporter receptor subunit TctC